MAPKGKSHHTRGNQGMISRNTIKLVRSLARKKHRDACGLFVAEGVKTVGDLLPLRTLRMAFVTETGLAELRERGLESLLWAAEVTLVKPSEMERLSFLETPPEVLAVFAKPSFDETFETLSKVVANELCLALDGVQDPGNVGTIVRLADWFGVEHIFASQDTADVYGPKVVQASMGSIGRVQVHYLDLPDFVTTLPKETLVYGTFLDGPSIYVQNLEPRGLLVMGNEGKGISVEVAAKVNRKLFIPSFPASRPTGESLNVAVATAILCAEFRRPS